MNEDIKQQDTTNKGMEYEPMLVAGLTLDAYLKKETATRKASLWGTEVEFAPHLCETITGDGLQLVYLSSIDMRPYYWLMRIDSHTDISDDDFDWENELLIPIEEECGGCNCDDLCECQYPQIRWGGGSWGMVANFRTGEKGS